MITLPAQLFFSWSVSFLTTYNQCYILPIFPVLYNIARWSLYYSMYVAFLYHGSKSSLALLTLLHTHLFDYLAMLIVKGSSHIPTLNLCSWNIIKNWNYQAGLSSTWKTWNPVLACYWIIIHYWWQSSNCKFMNTLVMTLPIPKHQTANSLI